MVDKDQIERLMKRHFDVAGNISINITAGTVSVNGDVRLKSSIKADQLPVNFEHVSGDFYCDNNQLTGLEGVPTSVGGDFYCYNNQLASLKGAPKDVGGDFYCHNNQLASLEGAPIRVGKDFYCNNNQLASLEGAPSHVGDTFFCSYIKDLPLLKLLSYQKVKMRGGPAELTQVLDKYVGQGRRGAIQAAREIMQAGELLQQEQGLDHNPFEANARW